jgi:release factor glutamine methyltransferase
MTSRTDSFTRNFVLALLLCQFLAVFPISSLAEGDQIVRHALCEQALVEGYPLTISEVLSQKMVERRKIWVAPLRTEIEVLLLNGIYPPYYYGHTLLDMAVRRLRGNERVLVLGVGSGYDAVILQKRFPHLTIEAVDINAKAVINTELNLAFHNIDGAKAYRSDLFNEVKGKFDMILFNAPRNIEPPPGVVAEPGDEQRFDLSGQIHARFLNELADHLSPHGNALIMSNAETKYDPRFRPQQLTTGSWTDSAPSKGSYGIFLLSPNPL